MSNRKPISEAQLQRLIAEHYKDFGLQYLAARILNALKANRKKAA